MKKASRTDPAKPDPSTHKPSPNKTNDLGELNVREKAILEQINKARQATAEREVQAPPETGSDTDWVSVAIGQRVELAGFPLKVSHISRGFIVLEADESPTKAPESFEGEETAWRQLRCTDARSLIRIDGTPFYVETRILSSIGNEDDQ